MLGKIPVVYITIVSLSQNVVSYGYLRTVVKMKVQNIALEVILRSDLNYIP